MKFGVQVNQHIVLTLCNHLHLGLPRNTQVNALIKYDLDQLMIKQIDLLLIHSPSHPTCNSSDQIALTWEAMQVGTTATTATTTCHHHCRHPHHHHHYYYHDHHHHHAHTHTHTHARAHTHTHTRAYTHTHTHAHAQPDCVRSHCHPEA
jgi:hypothetical protein